MAKSEQFTSRWGLIVAGLGMAVGTGSMWRFPRVAAQFGGAAFLIPWLVFLFVWSIPLLIAEFAIGRETRRGVPGAFARLGNDFNVGRGFEFALKYVVPVELVVMFVWRLQRAVTADPAGWRNPMHTFSMGTCLLQWGIAVILLLVFNGSIGRASLRGKSEEQA